MQCELACLNTLELAQRSATEACLSRQGRPLDEAASLALLHRAIGQRDDRAWEQVYHQWRGLLLHWLHQHPAASRALEQAVPDHFVTAALSKFWHATTHAAHRPTPAFATLAGALGYLRCCLNSVILDALRQARAYQYEVPEADQAEEGASPHPEASGADLWRCIERALPKRQERLLVYLRYVQGDQPREIAAAYPQEFPSVQAVYHLERQVLQRLRGHPALAPWKALPLPGKKRRRSCAMLGAEDTCCRGQEEGKL